MITNQVYPIVVVHRLVDLVAQPGYHNNIENPSLGRELNPRPLPHWSGYGGKSPTCASDTQAPPAPYQGNALPG
jgi:hypothetical protein